MKLVDKLMNYIMPPTDEEEFDEEELDEKIPEKSVKPEKKPEPIVASKPEIEKKDEVVAQSGVSELKVGNGASIPISSEPVATSIPNFSTTSTFQPSVVKSSDTKPRHAKVAELSVKVYNPLYFNEIVQRAADDLLSKCAVVVNYEQSNSSTQQRISDFLDGVCYIKDGSTRKISDKIILYAPSGVDTEAAMSVAMS